MTRCQSAGICSSSNPDAPTPRAGDQPVGRPVAGDRLLDRRRRRLGIAYIATDVAAFEVPGHDIGAHTAQPADDRAADPGPSSGDDRDHSGGPISSTRTPSGAVITAMATVLPPGAGISMRRTPSAKPSSANPAKVASTSHSRESRKKPKAGSSGDGTSAVTLMTSRSSRPRAN